MAPVDDHHSVIQRAQALADDVLFPAALSTDQADTLDVALLDRLADAGLYGLSGPREYGGLQVDPNTRFAVIEALATGCLTTTFVWMQHQSVVGTICALGTEATKEQWARKLCTGTIRGGVAFAHLRRPGPPTMTAARSDDGGWQLTGRAPWLSGWGRIDVVQVAAVSDDGLLQWCLIDAADDTLTTHRLQLAAVHASATIELELNDHPVPPERVVLTEGRTAWEARDAAGLRPNGALAIGVSRRAIALLGDPPGLVAALEAARHDLLSVLDDALPAARAQANALCLHTTAALVARGGGSSITTDQHAQRLAREALFLLVQGQTPAIRAAQVQLFGAGSR